MKDTDLICTRCKRPIYRPQWLVGGTVSGTFVHYPSCEKANEITPPLPTPLADALRIDLSRIAGKVSPERMIELGTILKEFDEAEYSESRGDVGPITTMTKRLNQLIQ